MSSNTAPKAPVVIEQRNNRQMVKGAWVKTSKRPKADGRPVDGFGEAFNRFVDNTFSDKSKTSTRSGSTRPASTSTKRSGSSFHSSGGTR
jgi:hypothetical protein